jgi:translocator protein
MDISRTVNTTEMNSNARGYQTLTFFGWLALCFTPTLTAAFVSTDGWFATLNKPVWNPPSWLFGPVWTILYSVMAVSAWLVWREGGWVKQRWPLILFLMQLILNALWTPLFFAAHSPALAFVEIVLLWLMIAATLWSFWPVSRFASLLLIPYLAWVSFAAVLNFTIWQLNAQ